jgi:hypothetical protein
LASGTGRMGSGAVTGLEVQETNAVEINNEYSDFIK